MSKKRKETHEQKLERFLKAAYDALNYCGWGDSWERECSEALRKELDEYFDEDETE